MISDRRIEDCAVDWDHYVVWKHLDVCDKSCGDGERGEWNCGRVCRQKDLVQKVAQCRRVQEVLELGLDLKDEAVLSKCCGDLSSHVCGDIGGK